MREGELERKIEVKGREVEIRRFFELRMMIVNDFDPSILEEIEKIALKRECDVIRIRGCGELENYFYKTTRIGFYRSLDEDLNLCDIPKNKRRGIKKALDIFDFSVTENIDSKEFNSWIEIYKKRMDEIERGVEILNSKWFENKDVILAFSKKDGEITGGHVILLKKENGETVPSLAFNSSKSEFFKHGINDFLLWNIINWLKERGYKKIKFGVDTNFYGFHLSPGLFVHKASWGFYPKIKGEMECLKILNFSKFGDVIFFITGKDKLEGNLLIRRGTKYDKGQLSAKNIERINMLEFDDKSLSHTD